MTIISRGFEGRRPNLATPLPPGQYLTDDFPVMSSGPTPRADLATWTFTVERKDADAPARATQTWDWDQLQGLGVENVQADIHCVTRWSKLATRWRGIPLDAVFASAFGDEMPDAGFVMAHCDGGYTANLPLADVRGGKAWIATEFDGAPLTPEHGAPARLLVPHLYFWKSAKWIRSLSIHAQDGPGFWEQNGYNMYGDPWKEERYW